MYFYPTFNTHDTLSISFCFSSSVICTYRFIVMPILECPSIFCNVLGIIPPSIHLVANVCLNMCMENLLISALSHILNNAVSYALFFTAVSYTHLDVYKRQAVTFVLSILSRMPFSWSYLSSAPFTVTEAQ